MVNFTTREALHSKKDLALPIEQGTEWAPEALLKFREEKNLPLPGIEGMFAQF
jgi:hypothetical protein